MHMVMQLSQTEACVFATAPFPSLLSLLGLENVVTGLTGPVFLPQPFCCL